MAVRSKKALGTKASYPGFIEPALASSLDKVPDGARWIHEIKFDGYRVQVHLYDGQVKVSTRRGNDWTKRLRFSCSVSGLSDGRNMLLTSFSRLLMT